jgi:hypothetical protein
MHLRWRSKPSGSVRPGTPGNVRPVVWVPSIGCAARRPDLPIILRFTPQIKVLPGPEEHGALALAREARPNGAEL